jgi:hypothetical protein
MKKTIRFIPSLLLMTLFVSLLTGCGAALADAAKLTQYEIGGDKIPSITSVVGEREVSGVESSTKNGVSSKQYTYTSDTVYDDLLAYVTRLMDDGWLVTQDIDLNVIPGSGELGKKSAEEGQILLVAFSYDQDGYAVNVTKGKGTIE